MKITRKFKEVSMSIVWWTLACIGLFSGIDGAVNVLEFVWYGAAILCFLVMLIYFFSPATVKLTSTEKGLPTWWKHPVRCLWVAMWVWYGYFGIPMASIFIWFCLWVLENGTRKRG